MGARQTDTKVMAGTLVLRLRSSYHIVAPVGQARPFSWSGTAPIHIAAHPVRQNQGGNTTMRYIRAFGILSMVFGPGFFCAAVFCPAASAKDLWTFNGICKESVVKEGAPAVDMSGAPGTAISCDAATITELDNGRRLVQFVQKTGEMLPPGFAGGEFKYVRGGFSLILDRVTPQRLLAGKQPDQIAGEAGKTAMPAEGYCVFGSADFSRLTEFSCETRTENAGTKILYSISFKVDDISVKRNVADSQQRAPAGWQVENTQWDFDRIFQYTLFDRTLPDGKHPVWIYYQAAGTIIRIDMPSLAMCTVMAGSVADRDVIKSGHADVISRTSKDPGKDWDFAIKTWRTALQHRLTPDGPEPCER
jgi:hypothetical protein